MHELSLTQAVVDAVVDRLGDTPVTRVTLEIGPLSGVVVDSVRFCFDLVAEGTPVAGAELVVVQPPGRAACRDCGREFEVDDPILLCPGCDGANVAIRSGDELRIRSVEVRRTCVQPADAPTTPH
ncbi:MAG TPA: hydrogenase maturation nickel metallochaperone HypA [Pseudonocardiaceae bacterium]|nr:hydrogenase maturation nickel metallochaperone HypA [Pseudonocardiaceae bacterium]